ncbi:hypothetical protein [Micromonospora sp. CA-246542]|uniref:hypothetical protein n=1 Tax=Micromonospora sp. CA-246542 TaxID=3239959 RepID=UPI003D8FA6EC
MDGWTYNDRPEGVRFLTERVAEPGRAEIEAEIWDWIVRGYDDPDDFLDYLDGDDERHGATDEAAYSALPEAEQQARYQADLERLLDEVAFPVLRRHGMRVEWNRKQSQRVRVTGAQW